MKEVEFEQLPIFCLLVSQRTFNNNLLLRWQLELHVNFESTQHEGAVDFMDFSEDLVLLLLGHHTFCLVLVQEKVFGAESGLENLEIVEDIRL